MHIAHITLSPGSAGHDTVLPALAQALASAGHQVTIYSRPGFPAPAGSAGTAPAVRTECVPGRPAGTHSPARISRQADTASGAWLIDRWRRQPPDIAHAHDPVAARVALAAARVLGIPLVQTFSCPASITLPASHRAGAPHAARIEAVTAHSISAAIATCSAEALRVTRLGVPRMSVTVIPATAAPVQFTPDGPAARRGGRPRLITAMSLADTSGYATLLRAMTSVPDAELLITDGPPRAALRKSTDVRWIAAQANALGLAGRVFFTGHLDHAAMPAMLRSADLMINVSLHGPHGTAAINAMACGTPVITVPAGCYADAVADGATGAYVLPGRPAQLARRIRELLTNPMLLQGYSIAAADRVQARYSWQRIAAETLAAYARTQHRAASTRAKSA